MRNALVGAGLKENRIYNALYSYANAEGKIILIMGSHVDDLLWANLPEANSIVEAVRKSFTWGAEDEMVFRFCGKEVVQDAKDYSIKVTCRDTTKKLKLINIKGGKNRKNLEKIEADEEQMGGGPHGEAGSAVLR